MDVVRSWSDKNQHTLRKVLQVEECKRTKRKIPPESETSTAGQPPPIVARNYLQPEAAATAALSASSGRA